VLHSCCSLRRFGCNGCRIPAAVCGVIGLKPTFGRISLDGIIPRAYTFDHAGPLTRSVEDCAIALQALAGHDRGNSTTIRKPVPDYSRELNLPVKPLRIGVDRQFAGLGQPAVLDRWEKALKKLEELGASIREVNVPTVEEFFAVAYGLFAEFSVSMSELCRQRPSELSPEDLPWQLATEWYTRRPQL